MGDKHFWQQKKVLITGHTGFKGSWLTLWLTSLGAHVTGYSSHAPSNPYLFDVADIATECCSVQGDINHFPQLLQVISEHQPEIIFHLAAQPLVQQSYTDPLHTFKTNVLGTVHLLEAARRTASVRVIINVTSDKCYKNDGLGMRSFQESDPLGGHDPYSASKACAELVTEAYRQSYFHEQLSYPRLASVRAGNVIGGGDWAAQRLFPDIVSAYTNSTRLSIRNPNAVRPWQHVLDPLHGYLQLAEKCWDDAQFAEAWNFGPVDQANVTVQEIIHMATASWGEQVELDAQDPTGTLYEAPVLVLNSSKSIHELGWRPKLSTEEAVAWTVKWYQQFIAGEDMKLVTQQQIHSFTNV
ncbi:CDP-glucose 4,6-dehydratase [Paenibacillus sp. 481]|uniref:CDP-glucose 4,6-dehydratase n=1 Tax=Paenibacillus sp. 481 TaxID=2835869 RepID=UPI003FA7CE8F